MRKFFSRRHKTEQTNQDVSQNHEQDSDLNSEVQTAQNIPIIEIQQDQQDNNIQEDASTQDNSDNNNDSKTHIALPEENNDNSNNNSNKNAHKSRSAIKHASTLPIHSEPFIYIVQEGDTLQSISEKFKIKESLIKKANGIYKDVRLQAGEMINLFTDFELPKKTQPIEVSIFDPKDQSEVLSGKLFIKNHDLIFSRKSHIFNHKHKINLCGYLESKVFPHPGHFTSPTKTDDPAYILALYYLKNPTDKTTSVTESFIGTKKVLETINIEIIKTADLAQEKVNYEPPNPDSIQFSQEFAETANISVKKRRKSQNIKVKVDDGPRTYQVVFLPQIQLINGQLEILKKTDVFLVRKKLPIRYQNSNWRSIYNSSIDGFSLATFFRKVANKRPLLFFMKTLNEDMIGAFIPSGMMISSNFYGNIETFLFKFKTEIQDLFITKLDDRREKESQDAMDQDDSILKQDIDESETKNENDTGTQENGNSEKNDQENDANTEINNDSEKNDQENDANTEASYNSEKNDQDDDSNSELNENNNSEQNDHNYHSILIPRNNDNENLNPEENNQNPGLEEYQNCEDENKNSEENNQNNDQITSQNETSHIETSDKKDDKTDNQDDQINAETHDPNSEAGNPNADQINTQNEQLNTETSTQTNENSKPRSNSSTPSQKPVTVIEVFKWNKLKCLENRNFVFSNLDCIMFGGGGSSALYIGKDMYSGYSDPCDTFCSPRLTKKKKFDVAAIEVWELS